MDVQLRKRANYMKKSIINFEKFLVTTYLYTYKKNPRASWTTIVYTYDRRSTTNEKSEKSKNPDEITVLLVPNASPRYVRYNFSIRRPFTSNPRWVDPK